MNPVEGCEWEFRSFSTSIYSISQKTKLITQIKKTIITLLRVDVIPLGIYCLYYIFCLFSSIFFLAIAWLKLVAKKLHLRETKKLLDQIFLSPRSRIYQTSFRFRFSIKFIELEKTKITLMKVSLLLIKKVFRLG